MVMVPSNGQVPWLKIQEQPEPTPDKLEALATSNSATIPKPTEREDDVTDPNVVSVQNLGYVPRAWAAYFLAPLSPWQAQGTLRKLLATLPPPQRKGFDFLKTWLNVACTHDPASKDSVLRARWQNPHTNRRVIEWMQRRTQYINVMPDPALAGGIGGQTLNPQECFNRALDTVAALRPPAELASIKKYTTAEMQRLRAACSLSVG
mgnify:CR=1 FL=1